MPVLVVVLSLLAAGAIAGTVWHVVRDGYGRRRVDPGYDSRRPNP